MEFVLNILTLSACIAAMTYCYVLSKRIASFRDMKEGIGALIEEMIRTTTDLQTAFTYTKHNIERHTDIVQDKIDEGVALSEYLENLLSEARRVSDKIQSLQRQNISNMTSNSQNYKSMTVPMMYSSEEEYPLTAKDAIASHTPEDFSTQQEPDTDPLADVMPAGFDKLGKKKKIQFRVPGEEYL